MASAKADYRRRMKALNKTGLSRDDSRLNEQIKKEYADIINDESLKSLMHGITNFKNKFIKHLGEAETEALKDCQEVNPNYGKTENGYKGAYTKNCQRCIWAWEMRRRYGLNVEAMPKINGDTTGRADLKEPKSYLNVAKGGLKLKEISMGRISAKTLDDSIANYPEGSRGLVRLHRSKSGHVINWEIINGKVHYYDCQAGKELTAKYITNRWRSGTWIARMDNVEVTDLIGEYVRFK